MVPTYTDTRLSQREILFFWLPLCASWLLMTMEGPVISATINRLPNAVIMLAAQGIVIGLSVFIESPIINLLATSTALVKDRQSFEMMRRFTLHWMFGLTAVTAIIGYTSAFDLVVVDLMGTPAEVAQWVRPGMQIMLFWSAAIAWRRFLQGVLIGFGRGRRMAEGTLLRLAVSAAVVISLALATELSGVHVATLGLMCGVIAEALFATWAVRPLLNNELSTDDRDEGEPLSYQELFWFHLPLASTSVLILFVQPLITAALARLDRPTESLAAWPVIFQTMLLIRAPALSLPEAIIALLKQPSAFAPLRRFSLSLTGIMVVLTAVFVFTPASAYYIFVVQRMEAAVGELARANLVWFLFFPSLWVLTAWLRGILIHEKRTKLINGGMMVNLIVTLVMLLGGVALRLPGLLLAAVTLNVASLAETIYLGWRANRITNLGWPRLKLSPATAAIQNQNSKFGS